MQHPAGRLTSASHYVATVLVLGLLATACSPDSTGVPNPVALNSTFDVLDLSSGSVIAQIESAWNPSMCMSVAGEMTNGSQTDLQSCAGTTSQKFELVSTSRRRGASGSRSRSLSSYAPAG